ncbi:MAG: phosphate acyltransferase PlsX, partial [Bacteroidota bacterium]
MLVGSIYKINTIPGIIRPCITSTLPQIDGSKSILLDVGSNADCKADVLYQFAVLGSLYAKNVYGIESPRVALLNIGEEETKG